MKRVKNQKKGFHVILITEMQQREVKLIRTKGKHLEKKPVRRSDTSLDYTRGTFDFVILEQ